MITFNFGSAAVVWFGGGLVLKSARRTESNRVPKRKAQGARRRRTHHGCEAHASWMRGALLRKILKFFHITQSIFCIKKLDKCIKKVIKNNITTKIANNLKICVVLL